MYLAHCLVLLATSLVTLTNALPATAPQGLTFSSTGLNAVSNLTFSTQELADFELTKQNLHVKFTNFHDATFTSVAADKVLGDAKESILKCIEIYGPNATWKIGKFGEEGFWLRFISFAPIAPDGLSTYLAISLLFLLSTYIESYDIPEKERSLRCTSYLGRARLTFEQRIAGAMMLGIIEQLEVQAQTQSIFTRLTYVAVFDVFRGSDAKGLLLGHGTIDDVQPKDWN